MTLSRFSRLKVKGSNTTLLINNASYIIISFSFYLFIVGHATPWQRSSDRWLGVHKWWHFRSAHCSRSKGRAQVRVLRRDLSGDWVCAEAERSSAGVHQDGQSRTQVERHSTITTFNRSHCTYILVKWKIKIKIRLLVNKIWCVETVDWERKGTDNAYFSV